MFKDIHCVVEICKMVLPLLSFLVALATFCLARKVQKEVVNTHAKQKQVEAMCDLVEYLNKTKICFYYQKSEHFGFLPFYELTLFEVGGLIVNNNMNDYSNDSIILLGEDKMQILDGIEAFLNNGFIPNNIANKLLSFYVPIRECVKTPYNCLVIGKVETHLWKPQCCACKDWATFKEASSDITDSIRKWYTDNGIKNYNIRIDYKYISKIAEGLSEIHAKYNNIDNEISDIEGK